MSTRALWNKWRPHLWPRILMLVCLLILAGHEVFEYVWTDDPSKESDPGLFTNYVYLHLADLAFHFHKDAGPPVTIVYIDPETAPRYLLTNTCLARDFIAKLVNDITEKGAKAIVIDKFYSDGSCPNKEINDNFRNALNASAERIPVVVGQQTTLSPKADDSQERCLEISPQFAFGISEGKISKVQYGLTRLNSDVLKIPRNWKVYNETSDHKRTSPNDKPDAGDSLSLVAATKIEQLDDDLKKARPVETFQSLKNHPYTSFPELSRINAMAVRCIEKLDPPPNPLCSCDKISGQRVDLEGKVVVIGDMSDQDMHPFPGRNKKEIAGVELQANYIKSILDSRFLTEVPFWITLLVLVVYIIAVYLWHFFMRSNEYAEITSLAALLSLLLIIFIALMFHYYTPLWAISCAAIFVVFRYFETKAHHYSDEVKEDGSHPEHGT